MPFLLITIGVVILASALKGTTAQLGQQFVSDLKGSAGNVGFVYWVSALIAVGALGYYAPAQKFSRAFMFLILSGMLLAAYAKNNQLFAQIGNALKNPSEPAAATGTTTATNTSGASQTASTAETLLTAEEGNIEHNVTMLATMFG